MAFDLDKNVNAELAKFGQDLKIKSAALNAEPLQNNTQVPLIVTPEPAKVTEIAPKPAEVTKPSEEPVAPLPVQDLSKVTSTEPKPLEDEPTVAWDADLITPIKEQPKDVQLTLDQLSSALKIDDRLKSTDDLVERFSKQEAKIKELETASTQSFEGLDPELVEAINIAKDKGDWKAVLGTRVVDYSRVDPVALFKNKMEQSQRFRTQDGKIDFDAVDAELAQIPISLQETQGDMLKQQMIDEQNRRRANIIQIDEQRKAQFNRSLAEAAKKVPEFLSKDKFGITVEPKHSDFLYNGIRTGTLVKKHLGNIDVSGVDPDKLIKTIALAEFGENISKHQYSQGIVRGKKELLAGTQNVQLNTPNIPPQPNVIGDKVETATDKVKKFIDKNKTAGMSL